MSMSIVDPWPSYPHVPCWPSGPVAFPPTPSPRVLPVNLPFPSFGVTVAVLDRDGNLTIKVDQLQPE